MSEAESPTLEDLRQRSDPAWLWDWQLGRAVWANPAGLVYFGCETLFDLIDRPFDPAEPGVERLVEIGRKLRRGQIQASLLFFPSSGHPAPVSANFFVHALSDGRPGLLITTRPAGDGQTFSLETLAQAFDVMPKAAMLVAKDGSVRYSNPSAVKQLGLHASAVAKELLGRAELAGTASDIKRVETPHGVRDLRIIVRLLPQPSEAFALVLADDITERRTLERQLAPSMLLADTGHIPALSPQEAEAFKSLGNVLLQRVTPTRPRSTFELPEGIRKILDGLRGACIIVQGGNIEYANQAAAELLHYQDPGEMAAAPGLIAAVKTLPADAQTADLPSADASSIRVKIERTTIPWRSGPALRLSLSAAEEAQPPSPTVEPADDAKEQAEVLAGAPTVDIPVVAPPATEQRLPVLEMVPAGSANDAAGEPVVADAELRAILDTATDGIITLDLEGHIKTLSAGAEAIFGYRSAELRQRPLADLLTAESRKTLRDYLAALQGPGLASVFNDGREVTAVVKQGGEVPLFLTIGKLQQAKPEHAAFCAVIRDITQWKKTEAELRRARDEAERSSRLKSEFLANVSHELRTPLNAIIGFSEMMRLESFGEIENEKYRSYVNDIHSSGSHLLSLINDLLDLSKVEAGKLELNFTSVNIGEVVEHALKFVQDQATQGRVILRKNIPVDLPNVVADLRSMRQIMLNILSNAVKFTDPGGQVVVSASMTPQGELKLRTKDTGVGMSAGEVKYALEPFRRVTTEGRNSPGTGLGLPLTKALAEANRTLFDISSETGKGTTVEITFPTTRVLAV